jgi:hypothetical protein
MSAPGLRLHEPFANPPLVLALRASPRSAQVSILASIFGYAGRVGRRRRPCGGRPPIVMRQSGEIVDGRAPLPVTYKRSCLRGSPGLDEPLAHAALAFQGPARFRHLLARGSVGRELSLGTSRAVRQEISAVAPERPALSDRRELVDLALAFRAADPLVHHSVNLAQRSALRQTARAPCPGRPIALPSVSRSRDDDENDQNGHTDKADHGSRSGRFDSRHPSPPSPWRDAFSASRRGYGRLATRLYRGAERAPASGLFSFAVGCQMRCSGSGCFVLAFRSPSRDPIRTEWKSKSSSVQRAFVSLKKKSGISCTRSARSASRRSRSKRLSRACRGRPSAGAGAHGLRANSERRANGRAACALRRARGFARCSQ